MKHTFLTLSLLLFCMQQITFSMDEPCVPLLFSDEKHRSGAPDNSAFFITINDAINNRYTPSSPRLSPRSALREAHTEDMLDIIKLINEWYPNLNPSHELMQTLYLENKYFGKAINHFIMLVCEKFNNAICSNLKTIEKDSTKPLSELSPAIKDFIMHHAKKCINVYYRMPLPCYTSEIESFCICPAAHRAAMSCKNAAIYIWDLAKHTCIRSIQEEAPCIKLRFSQTGSQLATLPKSNLLNHVHIWDIKTEQPREIVTQEKIKSIEYGQQTTASMLAIFTGTTRSTRKQLIYSLDTQPAKLLMSFNTVRSHSPCTDTEMYKAPKLSKSKTKLIVEKRYSPSLYCCIKAIENTQDPKLKTIRKSPPYKHVTTLEKRIIEKVYDNKMGLPEQIKRESVFV